MKLLRQLETCRHQSLVLIDELELALHPKAQIGLLRYLDEIAREKSLTVIFSTHSSNLIKSIERNNFYFIDKSPAGRTKVIKGCYPTYALGQLVFQEERSPDIVISVEDEQAQFIVEALKIKIFQTEFVTKPIPTVVVAPLGVFTSIISFLRNSAGLFPPSVHQCALLDIDARDEYLTPLRQAQNHRELEKFDRVSDLIKFPPWTPEVGLCEFLRSDIRLHETGLREFFQDARISFSVPRLNEIANLQGKERRKRSKAIVQEIIDEISQLIGSDSKGVRQDISKYFAECVLDSPHRGDLPNLLLPILNR